MHRLDFPASFYARRSFILILRYQFQLTFQEIRAFRLTLPWLERAQTTASQEMMGKS